VVFGLVQGRRYRRRSGAVVKVERPAGRTTLTAARGRRSLVRP
jgi:hypothetical protein